ncbi:MAG: glutamine synthetase III [Coriobacteriales bacterium]|jgi:glutamine synthetase|nr:glutamine synthetase III [Coriobacteriales bacterium]
MSTISELYGSLVFDDTVMQERLPRATYKVLSKTIKEGQPLDLEVANVVAHAMKEWAMELGATHYTHWFQPLTGITSEKHDSFLNPTANGGALMSFSGKELIQGEPDASSFPSGGIRATFEARGYTAWDPTSYAFIKDGVLCVPTAFVSYTGEALDKKTPLLRSMDAIGREAKRVLALFGKNPTQVATTVGPEQEYFLIKESDYENRLDLIMTGRTLFGADPTKGQELEEHYFGAVRPTVKAFMNELNTELWKLGVPAKTEHNEVAPAQHELAPVFLTTNRAIDANLLTMELMRKIASHYGLVCLQHEKPFAGINGNGKHNNWSISADGENLLEPGSTPSENLQFLVFLTAVIKAVDEYQGLLRMSVASAGNDHRLGANEAPPAIISIFLGDELGSIVEDIINKKAPKSSGKIKMDLGVPTLPTFIKDNTDRNRTSPFAFTGNKFEFRMPGGEVNLSDANMILNTIVAEALTDFADSLKKSKSFEKDAMVWVQQTLSQHQHVIFNGDNYSSDWPIEAEKRGLLNLKSTPDAVRTFIEPKSVQLFKKHKVLSKVEVESRYEVKLEHYSKKINIEGLVTARMARARFLPAIIEYSTAVATAIDAKLEVLENIKGIKLDTSAEQSLLEKLTAGINAISAGVEVLEKEISSAQSIKDSYKNALAYEQNVIPAMDAVRKAVDEMEVIVGHDYWPVPTYNHMLFYT